MNSRFKKKDMKQFLFIFYKLQIFFLLSSLFRKFFELHLESNLYFLPSEASSNDSYKVIMRKSNFGSNSHLNKSSKSIFFNKLLTYIIIIHMLIFILNYLIN